MFDDGFLAIWNDVSPAIEAEYRRWHRIEHMPERLAVPGFTRGRRYVDLAGARNRYLTVYEGHSVETFRSAPYRARLAAPTPWTSRMSAEMSNFVRRVCRTAASEGIAIGAAAAAFRLQLADHDLAARAAELVHALIGVDGTVAAHLGAVDAEISGTRADALQAQMASTGVAPFNAVLIVEGDSRASVAALIPQWRERLAQLGAHDGAVTAQVYDLALLFVPVSGENNHP